ncbi:MAG: leucine-rich repeat domain-containing protein [Muribaculaceae bacterium]|nr:leucine-rich repeat domain-containing protein [Muribaculaceae bacterium]
MKRFVLALFCMALAIASKALDIEISAGGLQAAVSDPAEVTSLTVKGSVDASDFDFIATHMDALRQLDLSGATVSAYNGEALQGLRYFEADVLPAMLLAGSSIEKISLPRGLKAIGDCALAGTRLTAVELPSTLQRVGSGAFAGCRELTRLVSACPVLGDGAFASCHKLALVKFTAATRLGARTFADCTALADVEGSADVTAIGDDAFAGCTALGAFDFGPALGRIGARAFSGSGLVEADMSGCSKLAAIGAAAFSRCHALKSLTVPAGCDMADASALALNSPELVEVKMAVTEIPAYALASNTSVSHIDLPPGLEYIGDHAMAGMTGLKEINATGLNSVPELGKEVWRGVKQDEVVLTTASDLANAFRSAAQWQEFDINYSSLGVDVIGVSPTDVSARFVGPMLQVKCTGNPVATITVADVEGHILATLTPDADGMATLDTAAWATDIYLLAATGSNFRATLKLVRTN